jgi:hypothetical protein
VRARVIASGEDVSAFDDALRIFALKDDVKAFNHFRMRQLNRLVLLEEATHIG